MRSIRGQLTWNLLAGLFLIFGVCGLGLYAYVRHVLTRQFEDALADKAHAFAATSEHDDGFEFEFTEAALPEFQPSPEAEYYQVWDIDGNVVAKSPSLAGAEFALPRNASIGAAYDVPLPDGRPGRALALRFAPRVEDGEWRGMGERLVVVMARSRAELDRVFRVLLSGLLTTGVLIIASAVLCVRVFIRRGLRPLDALASHAAAIDAGCLAQRFPADDTPREIQPIGARLNDLLERLDTAFARERRFTADVAHELRTPIAELRALAEVGLRVAPDFAQNDEVVHYLRDALAIAAQMERLVTTLLARARGESGLQAVARERTEIGPLVQRAWGPLGREAEERGLSVEFRVPPKAFVDTDPTLFGAVMANLLGNAVTHSPRDGQIRMAVSESESVLRLTLSNTSERLEREDLTHMFEAFWRKDKARSDSSHSGLGLAVVATFCRLLDVSVSVALPSDRLFQVVLLLPVAPKSAGP